MERKPGERMSQQYSEKSLAGEVRESIFPAFPVPNSATSPPSNSHRSQFAAPNICDDRNGPGRDINAPLPRAPRVRSKRKRPGNRGAPKIQTGKSLTQRSGRLYLQNLTGACDRDGPRLHRLWNLAHEVDV